MIDYYYKSNLERERNNSDKYFTYSTLSLKIVIKKYWRNVLMCVEEFKAEI